MHNHKQHQCGEHTNFKDELIAHLPFSLFSVIVSIPVVALLCFIIDSPKMELGHGDHTGHTGHESLEHTPFLYLFELFHYMHILFSGAATAALLTRKNISVKFSLTTGVIASIVICLISDSLIPWTASSIIEENIPLHLCVLEHFPLTFSFSVFGSFFGLLLAKTNEKATILSHSAHVVFSTLGSLFYIISFTSPFLWLQDLHIVFFFTLTSIMIPCCLSDFYIPMLFVKKTSSK